jgi:hypothetical protein
MGYLYHGYVSHNQRVPVVAFLWKVIFDIRFPGISEKPNETSTADLKQGLALSLTEILYMYITMYYYTIGITMV